MKNSEEIQQSQSNLSVKTFITTEDYEDMKRIFLMNTTTKTNTRTIRRHMNDENAS